MKAKARKYWLIASAAWLAVIIVVSLYPLRVNLDPHRVQTRWESLFRSWGTPQQSWMTFNDMTLNILFYLPLGFLFAFIPRSRGNRILLLFAGTLLSASMEIGQVYFSRYPSFWDIVMNSIGYLLGYAAGLGMIRFRPTRRIDSRIARGK
jgi:VanZ family protein